MTLNYGIRYDIEFTEEFAPTPFRDPLTGITLSAADVQVAQDALNVTQGFPRDTNNWAPRVGVAWDVFNNGKTVVRAAGGMFYDHPLLAVAFNSDIGDGSQQQQATLLPIGGPSPTGLFNAFQVFHGTVCGVQGSNPTICGSTVTPGVASSAQYLFGQQRFNPANFTGFGPLLPFTLNVAKDFQYPYAFQGNLGIEQMVGKDMSVSASYITVNARPANDYFVRETNQMVMRQSLELIEVLDQYDIQATVAGGGHSAQAEAMRHGIARALCEADPERRSSLKRAGFLTRDARKKERKKYGQPGARKRFQYSKR